MDVEHAFNLTDDLGEIFSIVAMRMATSVWMSSEAGSGPATPDRIELRKNERDGLGFRFLMNSRSGVGSTSLSISNPPGLSASCIFLSIFSRPRFSKRRLQYNPGPKSNPPIVDVLGCLHHEIVFLRTSISFLGFTFAIRAISWRERFNLRLRHMAQNLAVNFLPHRDEDNGRLSGWSVSSSGYICLCGSVPAYSSIRSIIVISFRLYNFRTTETQRKPGGETISWERRKTCHIIQFALQSAFLCISPCTAVSGWFISNKSCLGGDVKQARHDIARFHSFPHRNNERAGRKPITIPGRTSGGSSRWIRDP